MGWYGIFLVKKIRLAFSLRSMGRDNLYSAFDSLDRFIEKCNKISFGEKLFNNLFFKSMP